MYNITRPSYRISQSFSTTVILYDRKNVNASCDCARMCVQRRGRRINLFSRMMKKKRGEEPRRTFGANVLRVLNLSKDVMFVLKHKWINDYINELLFLREIRSSRCLLSDVTFSPMKYQLEINWTLVARFRSVYNVAELQISNRRR